MKYAANIHYGDVVCISHTPYLNLDHTFVVFGKHLLDHYDSWDFGFSYRRRYSPLLEQGLTCN